LQQPHQVPTGPQNFLPDGTGRNSVNLAAVCRV
jgi:hypothetical protein